MDYGTQSRGQWNTRSTQLLPKEDTIDTVVTLNYLFCVVERRLVGEEVFVLQKYTDHLTGHCNHQNTLTIR